MDKKKIPYAVRVSAALLAGKTDEAFNVIGEALTDIVGKISKVSQDYCYIDLPFVIAALRVTANAFESTIDDKGKERLARLKQETLDNYRQYIGWVEQDGEAYAMELLRRCSEQALQEELKINDMRESKDHILPGGSAEAQRADMLRAMEAVSAKMAAERGITRQPLAVLSQSEISRRMSAI